VLAQIFLFSSTQPKRILVEWSRIVVCFVSSFSWSTDHPLFAQKRIYLMLTIYKDLPSFGPNKFCNHVREKSQV
jgi:hypothetical protein